VGASQKTEDVRILTELSEAGKIHPVIDTSTLDTKRAMSPSPWINAGYDDVVTDS